MPEKKGLPARSEISKADRWQLGDLFASDEAWEAEYAAVQRECARGVAWKGRLGESARSLYEYLHWQEALSIRCNALGNYAARKGDEDTRISQYQAMLGRFGAQMAEERALTAFETPEILAIPDAKLEGFFADEPKLARYRRQIGEIRRRRAHTLSEPEEKLLAAAEEMADAPDSVYSAFANADLQFPDAVDSTGASHPVSAASFASLEESPDRSLRRSAYESVYTTYAGFRHTAAGLLNAQGKQLKFFADARKYPSTLDAALDRTNVPRAVYENLIATVHQNLDKMHRYVRLRKRLLGVDELHFYDVYTPLVQEAQRRIPYAEAKQMVYDALWPLGDEYRAILLQGFDSRWIDVYPNAGKRSGAYSAGAAVHPYVLMNYSGNLDSVFTLAHEMGHALHSCYSDRHQASVDSHYPIFVAEVASTCNEALLMEHLLGKTPRGKERAYLINHFLEQFKGTLYRQTMFAEFELLAGEQIGAGKTLTADSLCEAYKRLNAEYFGPDMVVDDQIAMEWARIPHFYYNYYVFQYATGYCAAIALSRRILREGESAAKDYLGFLSSGCTKPPIELLRGAGVDMASPEPVNSALALFGELLDEMEALAEGM